MNCKKVAICSLFVGGVIGAMIAMMNNSLDYKICYLRRKLNCLNRKLNRVLKNMSEENLKKYKDELVNGYENIKNKIESLTIKDIKDKGNEIVNNIIESIKDLKDELITYSR